MAFTTAREYLVDSRLRAATSVAAGSGLVAQTYRDLVRSGAQNRYRNNYVPRNLAVTNPNPAYDTVKITLPMGTVLFRAIGHRADANSNMGRTQFHYFYPLAGLGVAGLSQNYSRFCMFALKYDTNFFLLIEPGTQTKQWVTKRNGDTGLVPPQFEEYRSQGLIPPQSMFLSGADNKLSKEMCRSAGVQGWIGLSGEDAHAHAALANHFPAYFNKPTLMSNASKFVHFNSHTRTQGFAGFPECVMWYEDLQYNTPNPINRRKKIVIEPIVCLHMPTGATDTQRLEYLNGFYKKVMGENLLQVRTTATVTGGGSIPFAHFVFPQMSTKDLTKAYLATSRANLN